MLSEQQDEKKGQGLGAASMPAPPIEVLDAGDVWLSRNIQRVQHERRLLEDQVAMRRAFLATRNPSAAGSSCADKVAVALDRSVATSAQMDVFYPHLPVRSLDPDDDIVEPAEERKTGEPVQVPTLPLVSPPLPPLRWCAPWMNDKDEGIWQRLLAPVIYMPWQVSSQPQQPDAVFVCTSCKSTSSCQAQPYMCKLGQQDLCLRCLLAKVHPNYLDEQRLMDDALYWCDKEAAKSLRFVHRSHVVGADVRSVKRAQRFMDTHQADTNLPIDLWFVIASFA
jgi:hypothetical protein